jgi:DNA-directed RNA polymerase specialized sigma24 family protein
LNRRNDAATVAPVSARRFPRALIRLLETRDLPLQTLGAIHEMRAYLDELEGETLVRSRELGASSADIARALGISRQAVYNKLHALERRSRGEPIVVPELEESPTD